MNKICPERKVGMKPMTVRQAQLYRGLEVELSRLKKKLYDTIYKPKHLDFKDPFQKTSLTLYLRL